MIEEAAKSSSVAVLTERGMPKVIAQDLSDRDAKALAAAESFAEIKSSGENHAEVRLIGGMTGKNDYKPVSYTHLFFCYNERIDPTASLQGSVH